jgi:hypothetical protein
MTSVDVTLQIRIKAEFEDKKSDSETVKYLIEQDLLDNNWDVEEIKIISATEWR